MGKKPQRDEVNLFNVREGDLSRKGNERRVDGLFRRFTREDVPEAGGSAGRALGFLSSLRYARNDKEGTLRSEFIMRVATLTTVDENRVGFSVVARVMAGAGDGFPSRIGVRGRLLAGTTHAGCDRHTQ